MAYWKKKKSLSCDYLSEHKRLHRIRGLNVMPISMDLLNKTKKFGA
jgi:hypothetical protein